jgi:hypothetical protein
MVASFFDLRRAGAPPEIATTAAGKCGHACSNCQV